MPQLKTGDRERIWILYYDARLSPAQIENITGFTKRQIRYTIQHGVNTAPRSGRPRVMTAEQDQELVEFVCRSRKARRMSFLELSTVVFNGAYGMWAIKNSLYRLGFRRRVARNKPPISERTRQTRLRWAQEHVGWTREQWDKVLWSDETWVVGGPHRKQYVTRRQGEEYDDTCIVEKHQRKQGWMFWGSFSGHGKGPGVFWEKNWGSITSQSYREHIVPVIHNWIVQVKEGLGDDLIFMQDGAPGHSAKATKDDLLARGIPLMEWPAFSPDLNPIEHCWNWLKDYVEDKYGLEEKPSYTNLRAWVLEAWEEIPQYYLDELLSSMPRRCQAVIDANGMHTKY